MSFRITGLEPGPFAPFFSMSAEELEQIGARRVVADRSRGYPCRVSLEDARQGEVLLLTNFVSHTANNPYRSAHAIYVREGAKRARDHVDCLPPVFAGRTMSLRGFDKQGMMTGALLALPEFVEKGIEELFAKSEVACIHAHNAAYGCFAAKIERAGEFA